MIKLCGAYGVKIPGPKEYSSESYHASAEIELAGTADGEGLKAALGLLWEDLKAAVEAQMAAKHSPRAVIAGSNGQAAHPAAATPAPAGHQPPAPPHQPPATPVNRSANRGGDEPASKKQIGFLLALCRRHKNLSAEQTRNWLQAEHGLRMNQMTKADAAGVIDQLQGK